MKDSLISILVPIYNVESYISSCIDSIVNQTYKKIEIILIDDGSTDKSGEMCEKYSRQDDRVKVIHKENGGLVDARKAAISAANGELVLNIDGDDWVDLQMVEKLYDIYKTTKADVVQCGYIGEGKTGKVQIYKDGVYDINRYNCSEMVKEWMSGSPIIDNPIVNKLITRTLFEKVYCCVPNSMSYGEDCVFLLNMVSHDIRVAVTNECLYHYRIRDNSLSHLEYNSSLVKKEVSLIMYLSELMKNPEVAVDDDDIDKWMINRTARILRHYEDKYSVLVGSNLYENINNIKGKRIVIYGAGMVGRDYILQLSRYEDIEIVAWVDKKPYLYNYQYRKVSAVECLHDVQFDYIIISLLNNALKEQICEELITNYYIDKEKILL